MERTLLETEEKKDRDSVAAYLRQLADRLESGDPVTLSGGGQDVELDVPEVVEFEVKVEEDAGETSLELEIEWNSDDVGQSDQLDIT